MCYLLWLSLSVFVQDDDQVDLVKARVNVVIEQTAKVEKYLEETIPRLEKSHTAAKRGRIGKTSTTQITSGLGRNADVSYFFPSKEVKDETIKQLAEKIKNAKERLKKLTNREELVFPELAVPVKIGDFGKLNTVRVIQVIGPDEMLVEYAFSESVDPKASVLTESYKQITLFVRSVSTVGVVDDQPYKTEDVFEVVTTETYSTAIGGTNTVFVVKPLDTELLVKHIRTTESPKVDKKK